MARFLHIETSTKVCSVAISEDGQLVDFIEESSDKYIHAERITVFIQEICKRNQWELQELSAIVVTSGPGSYTGLRIGVSTAKGLCYALGLPLISVDSLESIAHLAQEKHPNTSICAMIDARRMEVFSTIYNAKLQPIKLLSADILEEDTYSQFEPLLICGDGAEKTRDLWKNREQVTIDSTILSSARGQVTIALRKFQANEFEDVAYYEPKYLKDFVATTPKDKSI